MGGGAVWAQPFATRPVGSLVEQPTPRTTGNSFLQLWRVEDLGVGPGNTAIALHPGTGYAYVGNSQGVLEFDGARWQVAPLPHGGAVLALAIDGQGKVWAASENEIVRLEANAAGLLHAVTVVHPLPDGEVGSMDKAVAAPDGVWFGGVQHIIRVNAAGGVATWRTGERFGLLWWMDGAVHTKISEREIVRLEEGGRWSTVLRRDELRVPPNRASPLRVFAAREGVPGEWILLTALGPVRWQPGTGLWRALGMRPPLFRDAEALAAAFLPDGAMVFVTTRPGGVVVTPVGKIERLLDRLPAIMNPRVSHMAADAEGGLWVTSRDHVARLQLRAAYARHEGAQGLQGNPRALLRHGEALYVAHSAGVSRYHEWPGSFPPAEGLHRGAEALAVVGDRVLAAASGLVEISREPPVARALSTLAITSVTGLGGRDDVIFSGDASGLWWFQREEEAWRAKGRVERVKTGVAGLFDAGDGWLWGTTTDGRIWKADTRGGVRLDLPVAWFGPAEGVLPTAGRAGRVHLFKLGDAVVATCGAWILRYDATANRFLPETRIAGIEEPGKAGAEAVTMNPDGSGWLRMAAPDRRLLRLRPDGRERWRTVEHPAPMIRDLAVVSLLEDRGTLWVAGKDLLVSIDLAWESPTALPPLVARLRQVTADGQVISLREVSSVNEQPGPVRFEFAAPSFTADHRGRPLVRYRTQLVGLEKDWSAWSAEPWRDFTKLPAGNYTFRLQATDQGGRVSPETEVAFVVAAPWWRSRWAGAGYALMTGAAVLGVVRLRTRTLRRRAERLEAMVAARTEELRRTNAELARLHRLELNEKAAARLAEEEARLEVLRYQLNPHFLYNALNSVYSLVLTTPPAAANMVLRLADFCRVALDRRHEERTTVGAEFDKLTNYLEIEKVRWGDSLHVTVEAEVAARGAALPPFLLLPLVENAIKYGGATSPDELHVRVTARQAAEALVLTVANTGSWVERKPGENGSSSGIGLTNLRQRLQRYHPNAHEVSIATVGGWVVVTLTLRGTADVRSARREATQEVRQGGGGEARENS